MLENFFKQENELYFHFHYERLKNFCDTLGHKLIAKHFFCSFFATLLKRKGFAPPVSFHLYPISIHFHCQVLRMWLPGHFVVAATCERSRRHYQLCNTGKQGRSRLHSWHFHIHFHSQPLTEFTATWSLMDRFFHVHF